MTERYEFESADAEAHGNLLDYLRKPQDFSIPGPDDEDEYEYHYRHRYDVRWHPTGPRSASVEFDPEFPHQDDYPLGVFLCENGWTGRFRHMRTGRWYEVREDDNACSQSVAAPRHAWGIPLRENVAELRERLEKI